MWTINGETFPRWICCHGFLFPLLFSLVYFPFYCPLLLEGININEFHNVVCTPLLTLVRVATPYWAIISKAGNSQPQTISFTFLESRNVPLKKKKMLFIHQCAPLSARFKIPSGAIIHLQRTQRNKCLRVTKSSCTRVTSQCQVMWHFIHHLPFINGRSFMNSHGFVPSGVTGMKWDETVSESVRCSSSPRFPSLTTSKV